jgi:hypothetical protein
MFAAVADRSREYDCLFNFEDHPSSVKKRPLPGCSNNATIATIDPDRYEV